MKRSHLVGVILWRGGILLILTYVAYMARRTALALADPQLEFAVAIGLTGVLLIFVSLIMERVADAAAEGELAGDGG